MNQKVCRAVALELQRRHREFVEHAQQETTKDEAYWTEYLQKWREINVLQDFICENDELYFAVKSAEKQLKRQAKYCGPGNPEWEAAADLYYQNFGYFTKKEI